MSRTGTKTITVPQDFHEALRVIAERNGLDLNMTVMIVFGQQFPKDVKLPKRVPVQVSIV